MGEGIDAPQRDCQDFFHAFWRGLGQGRGKAGGKMKKGLAVDRQVFYEAW
jgi:hypothetical protein